MNSYQQNTSPSSLVAVSPQWGANAVAHHSQGDQFPVDRNAGARSGSERKRRLTESTHERRSNPYQYSAAGSDLNQAEHFSNSLRSMPNTNPLSEGAAGAARASPASPASFSGGAEASEVLPPHMGRRVSDIHVPQWQPDTSVTKCPVCNAEFSFWYRKHHCRKCGRVVCAACSPHRITIPRQYVVQPPSWNEGEILRRLRPDLDSDTSDQIFGGEVVRVCNPCVPDPWTPDSTAHRGAQQSPVQSQVSQQHSQSTETHPPRSFGLHPPRQSSRDNIPGLDRTSPVYPRQIFNRDLQPPPPRYRPSTSNSGIIAPHTDHPRSFHQRHASSVIPTSSIMSSPSGQTVPPFGHHRAASSINVGATPQFSATRQGSFNAPPRSSSTQQTLSHASTGPTPHQSSNLASQHQPAPLSQFQGPAQPDWNLGRRLQTAMPPFAPLPLDPTYQHIRNVPGTRDGAPGRSSGHSQSLPPQTSNAYHGGLRLSEIDRVDPFWSARQPSQSDYVAPPTVAARTPSGNTQHRAGYARERAYTHNHVQPGSQSQNIHGHTQVAQQAQPRPRRIVREEDECPVCGAEMPAGEAIREQHIIACIQGRFSSSPSQATTSAAPAVPNNNSSAAPLGTSAPSSIQTRPRASTYRPRGMAISTATEKDCVNAEGEEQECIICLEAFQPGDELARMECLCIFHRACIRLWWQTKGQGSCPTHQLQE